MTTKTVIVTQTIKIDVDESKFNETFMEEFREFFYPFTTINEHIEHLGQLYARGMASNTSFIEGYGPAEEMGIKFLEDGVETEIE